MDSQKKQIIILRCIIIILIGGIFLGRFTIPRNDTTPIEGWVPDEKTAIRIAEAVWLPVFWDEMYYSTIKVEYNALRNCWNVRGTLSENERILGWLPEIIIDKKSGKILYVGIY